MLPSPVQPTTVQSSTAGNKTTSLSDKTDPSLQVAFFQNILINKSKLNLNSFAQPYPYIFV